jgi:hypothetical protein
MKKTTKWAVALAFLLCLGAGNAFALPKPAEWSQNDWVKFIEQGVQIGLGEALNSVGSATPMVDVYSALSAFGSSTNTGLQLWLNRKMQDAEAQNNTALLDKYQAYFSCLNGDCSRLQQLTQTRSPDTTACKEVNKIEQPETKEGTKITAEASTIHVMDCQGKQTYVYQYLNRTGFRVINPPDWGHAIGGKDFQSLTEAMNVAAGQTTGPTTERASSTQPSVATQLAGPSAMTLTVRGVSISVYFATGKVTASSGKINGTEVRVDGVGDFPSVDVELTANKPLPLGWNISAATCCSVVIPICKSEAGAASCSGNFKVPKEWPAVNIVGSITKADQAGRPYGSSDTGIAVVLWK